MSEEGGAARLPRPRWWLGPLGVLLGLAVVGVLSVSIDPGQPFVGFIFLSLLAIPAISGYALRALIFKPRRAAISSVGTAVGWVLLVGFLLSDLGATFFIVAMIFGIPGLISLSAFGLGFILVAQWSASEIVGRLSPSL